MEKCIIVFSDVHYSRNWDKIDRCLSRTPHFSNFFLNPNTELEKFVQQVNALNDIQSVINNGDSIDYHFTGYSNIVDFCKQNRTRKRRSNWEQFCKTIKKLRHPYYSISGNHDYRMEAYNYRIWGTQHVNLPAGIRRKLRHKIGHQDFRGPFELAAIRVNKSVSRPYFRDAGIQKRVQFINGPWQCILLDTGSDAFAQSATLFKYFRKLLQTRRISFDTQGLAPEDITYLAACLSRNTKKDVLIFQHAPLINSFDDKPGREYQLSIKRFDSTTWSENLSCNTILNGGAGLLKLLVESDRNTFLICSHTHTAKYFLIDKHSLTARQVTLADFNAKRNQSRYIKHLTMLPLGGFYPDAGGNRTGYLKISTTGFKEIVMRRFKKKPLCMDC